jgi:hypothetical protein
MEYKETRHKCFKIRKNNFDCNSSTIYDCDPAFNAKLQGTFVITFTNAPRFLCWGDASNLSLTDKLFPAETGPHMERLLLGL